MTPAALTLLVAHVRRESRRPPPPQRAEAVSNANAARIDRHSRAQDSAQAIALFGHCFT